MCQVALRQIVAMGASIHSGQAYLRPREQIKFYDFCKKDRGPHAVGKGRTLRSYTSLTSMMITPQPKSNLTFDKRYQ